MTTQTKADAELIAKLSEAQKSYLTDNLNADYRVRSIAPILFKMGLIYIDTKHQRQLTETGHRIRKQLENEHG